MRFNCSDDLLTYYVQLPATYIGKLSHLRGTRDILHSSNTVRACVPLYFLYFFVSPRPFTFTVSVLLFYPQGFFMVLTRLVVLYFRYFISPLYGRLPFLFLSPLRNVTFFDVQSVATKSYGPLGFDFYAVENKLWIPVITSFATPSIYFQNERGEYRFLILETLFHPIYLVYGLVFTS